MSIVIFDTETTGLVKSVEAPERVQPRLIEFYDIRVLPENPEEVVDKLHLLIDPGIPRDTWEVVKDKGPNGSMISEEMLKGAPRFSSCIPQLQRFFLGAQVAVAHNLSFDLDMLIQELRRSDAVARFPWPPKRICTVEATEQIAGRRMGLTDLHTHLFGVGFDEAHLASMDVGALHRVFVELVKRGTVDPFWRP